MGSSAKPKRDRGCDSQPCPRLRLNSQPQRATEELRMGSLWPAAVLKLLCEVRWFEALCLLHCQETVWKLASCWNLVRGNRSVHHLLAKKTSKKPRCPQNVRPQHSPPHPKGLNEGKRRKKTDNLTSQGQKRYPQEELVRQRFC